MPKCSPIQVLEKKLTDRKRKVINVITELMVAFEITLQDFVDEHKRLKETR